MILNRNAMGSDFAPVQRPHHHTHARAAWTRVVAWGQREACGLRMHLGVYVLGLEIGLEGIGGKEKRSDKDQI